LRLRVLVGAAGTPRLVSGDPLDVLENGVIGARWVVADASEDDQQNEGRAELLRALQARAGTPARSLQQVLVRLPRRLSGPRLHGGPLSIGAWQHVQIRCEERGNASGWAEAIRWLRGRLPTAPERVSRERLERAVLLTGVELVPACWELSFQGAGLGLPSPQRYPRRHRSRRGRSRKQHQLEVELGLRVHAVADVSPVEPAQPTPAIAALDFRAQTFSFIGGEPEPVLSAELNVDLDDGFDPAEMLYNSNYIRAVAVLVGSDHLATLATGASRSTAAPRLSVIYPNGRSSSWLITDVTVEYLPHRTKNTRVVIHLLGQRGQ